MDSSHQQPQHHQQQAAVSTEGPGNSPLYLHDATSGGAGYTLSTPTVGRIPPIESLSRSVYRMTPSASIDTDSSIASHDYTDTAHTATVRHLSPFTTPEMPAHTTISRPGSSHVKIEHKLPTHLPTQKTTNSQPSDDDDDDISVCPQGTEATGRWTKEEHELFLEALNKYGKEWKKVAAMVKTRTVVQTRTHAQKYFQKVQKYVFSDPAESHEDVQHPMGVTPPSGGSEHQKSTSSKRPRTDVDRIRPLLSSQKQQPSSNSKQYDSDYFYCDAEIPPALRNNSTPVQPSGPLRIPSRNRPDLPPPSPASCGKRKAVEVAVAQALTGSASPVDMESGIHTLASMKEAVLRPHPALRPSTSTGSSGGAGGLSIINPEHLPSASFHSDDEPHTPWDGDMRELEKKQQMSSSAQLLVSTTAEQNEFIGNVCAAVTTGDVVELKRLLESAKKIEPLTPQTSERQDVGRANLSGSISSPQSTPMPPPTSSSVVVSADSQTQSTPPRIADMLNRVNENGESALMIACYGGIDGRRNDQEKTLEICKLLVEAGASPSLANIRMRTCLHIAAERGFETVAKYVVLKGCPVNDADENGDTAVHIAVQCGHVKVLQVLINCGANCHIRNHNARCALDMAVDCSAQNLSRKDIRQTMLMLEPRMRSLILYHEDCLEHAARRESDWEGPDRLEGIMSLLQDSGTFASYEIEISNQFEKAHVELLSRVHSPDYIAFVNTLSKQVQESGKFAAAAVPFTPHVQKTMMRQDSSETKHPEVCDTSFSSGTLKAARRAAGAVAHAVDRVLLGRNRNAFCVVRPPGHHAGYRGLLDGGKSCGFCIFNSVAAGALHALEAHHCERVAIIDIDVHHGNGTEDIVRRYQHPSRLFFFSLHLFEKDDEVDYEFFPGSGGEDDTTHNIINVPIPPMWLESSVSSHSTRSTGKPSTPSTRSGRDAFKQAITQRLIPSLRAFSPDLILLSTGFDCAEGDVGNMRNGSSAPPARGMNLKPIDFEWVTMELVKISDICCNGRLVSVLEGGYGTYPTPSGSNGKSSQKSKGNGLNRSILSEAACAHVSRLVDPYGYVEPTP